MLSARKGFISDAISNLQKATEMDPQNQEYRNAYVQIRNAGGLYRSASNNQGYQMGMSPSEMLLCSTLPFCFCC